MKPVAEAADGAVALSPVGKHLHPEVEIDRCTDGESRPVRDAGVTLQGERIARAKDRRDVVIERAAVQDIAARTDVERSRVGKCPAADSQGRVVGDRAAVGDERSTSLNIDRGRQNERTHAQRRQRGFLAGRGDDRAGRIRSGKGLQSEGRSWWHRRTECRVFDTYFGLQGIYLDINPQLFSGLEVTPKKAIIR